MAYSIAVLLRRRTVVHFSCAASRLPLGLSRIRKRHRFSPFRSLSTLPSAASGVLLAGGVFIGIGVALFLIFLLTDIISCCCCRPKNFDKAAYDDYKAKQGCLRKRCGVRCCFLLTCMATFVIAACGLIPVYVLRDGFGDLLNGALGLANTLIDTNDRIKLMPNNIVDFKAAAMALSSAAQSQSAPNIDADTAYAIGVLDGIATTVNDVVLNNPVQDAADAISGLVTGTIDVENIKNLVFIAGSGVIGAFLAYLLIAPMALCARRCCAVTKRALGFCDLLALAFVWIITGIFLLLGILTADICAAPGSSIVRLLNMTGAPRDAVETLDYYTRCPDDPEPEGAVVLGNSLYDALALANTTAYELAANATADTNLAWVLQYMPDILDSLPAPLDTATDIAVGLSCQGVYPSYERTIEGLCAKTSPAVITLWAMGVACSVLLFILAIWVARLCRFHPGDVETPTLKSSSPTASSNRAAPIRIAAVAPAPQKSAADYA